MTICTCISDNHVSLFLKNYQKCCLILRPIIKDFKSETENNEPLAAKVAL